MRFGQHMFKDKYTAATAKMQLQGALQRMKQTNQWLLGEVQHIVVSRTTGKSSAALMPVHWLHCT